MIQLPVLLAVFLAGPSWSHSRTCSELLRHPGCWLLPDDRHCGVRTPGQDLPVTRVMGGRDARLGQYPWMACLQNDVMSRVGECLCGGSLITARYVLTAAHCVDRVSGLWFWTLGEHDLRAEPDCDTRGRCAPTVQRIAIEQVVAHWRYRRPDNWTYDDVALTRLERPAELNRYVWPICLPISEVLRPVDHQSMEVAGWGRLNYGRNMPDVLQTAVVFSVPLAQCAADFLRAKPDDVFRPTRDHVCTTTTDRHGRLRTPYHGDSGGPLTAQEAGGTVLVGVVTLGLSEAADRAPAVYARVGSYIPWILDIIRP